MKKLSIHIFMHVPFEGIGCINDWITKNNHSISFTKFYESDTLPIIEEIDWLIVMGGPMGVYDENIYPWLANEKTFMRETIKKGKTVIGICLGSQLIAEVLGAKVYANKQKEIGWFNVKAADEGKNHPIITGFEHDFPVFHWHSDTFDLPTNSIRLFSSETTKNQAFIYKEKVLGLQFHLEVTQESAKEMVQHGESELIESETIQTVNSILNQTAYIQPNNQKMVEILDYLQNK